MTEAGRSENQLEFELDHVFICVGKDSYAHAAISALSEFGLDLSRRGIHKGQGTRNACAFFDNAYLELLFRDDDAALESLPVAPLMLRERLEWWNTGACPFGVCLRPASRQEKGLEVETWPYSAPYLPQGTSIPIITPQHNPDEPLVFLSRSPAPADLPPARRPPLIQRGARRRLTGLQIDTPGAASASAASRTMLARSGIQLGSASQPHLELEWDGGRKGARRDFTTILPLSIRW